MVKIRLLALVFVVSSLSFSSCRNKAIVQEDTTSSVENETDVTEIMCNRMEIMEKEGTDAEKIYILTMPDYEKILENYDNNQDIEEVLIKYISDDECPLVSIEIPVSESDTLDLESPSVKKAIEDEFTKAINSLLKKNMEERE